MVRNSCPQKKYISKAYVFILAVLVKTKRRINQEQEVLTYHLSPQIL